MKNCGTLIHDEIATKLYMEQLKELVKTSQNENVRQKILELIQAWAHAFRNSPKYRAVQVINNLVTFIKIQPKGYVLFTVNLFINMSSYSFLSNFLYIISFLGYIKYNES